MQAEEVAKDFSKPFEAIRPLGDTPEIKIGIYISCHGELIERTVIGPKNVIIYKQNLGGYGCSSYKVREPSDHVITALLLQDRLVGCSREEYQLMKKGLIDKHGVEIDTEGACESFSSMSGSWILKKYSYDSTKRAFIIAFQGRSMDMITCSREELEEFIGGDPKNEKYKKILDDFFAVRDTFFDTPLLFNLIYLFNKYQGVNVANILDESCNVQLKHKKPIPRDDVFPRGNSGYGGKRTRKNRKSRKRKN
jgi:hypothetical protein